MSKAKRSTGKTQPLTVRDFAWGCLYHGTREQIIGAGLIDAKKFPTKNFGRFVGSIKDPEGVPHSVKFLWWGDDDKTFSVAVEFGAAHDVNPFRIVADAQRAANELIAEFRERLESALQLLRPRPLSECLGIQAKNSGQDPGVYADEIAAEKGGDRG